LWCYSPSLAADISSLRFVRRALRAAAAPRGPQNQGFLRLSLHCTHSFSFSSGTHFSNRVKLAILVKLYGQVAVFDVATRYGAWHPFCCKLSIFPFCVNSTQHA
jgi:hypothetical protein